MSHSIQALIIDDDALNLEVISRLLKTAGISSIQAQTVQQIQSTLASLAFIADIVFLDLEMPQMNGYEVYQLIRAKLGNNVPIVACTVHSSEITTVRELGFDGFIAKPLDLNRFPVQVKQILDGVSVWEF